jgi:hypothetical protein
MTRLEAQRFAQTVQFSHNYRRRPQLTEFVARHVNSPKTCLNLTIRLTMPWMLSCRIGRLMALYVTSLLPLKSASIGDS